MAYQMCALCIIAAAFVSPWLPIYALSVPFVLGTSPSLPGTRLVAALTATARALKALSALWWSLKPRMQSTCIVILAACAKLSKQ